MYSLPTAPRPIGGVLDDAIRLYRASLSRCWLLAAVAGVLNAVASTYQTLTIGELAATRSAQGAAAVVSRIQAMEHSPGLWLSYLALLLVWLVIRAAIVIRQHAAAIGREDSIGSALASALRLLPNALITSIAWFVLICVGMVLLIVPGIWLWGMFQLWFVALYVEELGPVKALGRSWHLVERNWWRTTTVVSVALIIIAILGMTAGAVVGLFVALFHGNVASFTLATQLATGVISIFTTPLLTVVMLSIYYDLKLRREGGDLAVRLSSLQPA
jgi:hypothetical protein